MESLLLGRRGGGEAWKRLAGCRRSVAKKGGGDWKHVPRSTTLADKKGGSNMLGQSGKTSRRKGALTAKSEGVPNGAAGDSVDEVTEAQGGHERTKEEKNIGKHRVQKEKSKESSCKGAKDNGKRWMTTQRVKKKPEYGGWSKGQCKRRDGMIYRPLRLLNQEPAGQRIRIGQRGEEEGKRRRRGGVKEGNETVSPPDDPSTLSSTRGALKGSKRDRNRLGGCSQSTSSAEGIRIGGRGLLGILQNIGRGGKPEGDIAKAGMDPITSNKCRRSENGG